MAMLKRIQLKGYKSIREMDLELGPLNILIGANGAGKSNLLSFFNCLHFLASDNLDRYVAKSGGADSLLFKGIKTTDKIMYDTVLAYGTKTANYGLTMIGIAGDRLNILNDLPKSDIYDPKKTMIPEFFTTFSFHHFQDTSDSSGIKLTNNINDNHKLSANGGNLAAFLYLLKSKYKEEYIRICETIQLAAPFFEKFFLEPMEENKNTILLAWKEKYLDKPVYAYQGSDGILRMMCLVTLLLQPKPPELIIIDEPELGLHPYAITILADLLKIASQKTQIIVATQSVTLVDHFAPEDIIVADREGDESVFHRLNPEELTDWLEDYTLGELWQKNVLGGRP